METQRKTFQNCPNIRVLHKEGKNRTNIFIYIKAIVYFPLWDLSKLEKIIWNLS